MTTSNILDEAGFPQSFPTADGQVTREMMAIAYVAFAGTNSGLTSQELSSFLGLQDPGHARTRPGDWALTAASTICSWCSRRRG
jgi:hypothetical protein